MATGDQPDGTRRQYADRPKRRGPRPRGTVRAALVEAGLELARSGGPEAVVLREVTRMVGVVPNAAYRHFADRDALLAAVRDAALAQLAQRMADAVSEVRAGPQTPTGARLRLRAVGRAYLEFARAEPGLFDTAFAATEHPPAVANDEPRPLDRLNAALDDLVKTGLLVPARRPDVEYPTWAMVHGLAVLFRGPLMALPDREKARLEGQALAFIEASIALSPAAATGSRSRGNGPH
jgi:AcrR family transcriptional regulator